MLQFLSVIIIIFICSGASAQDSNVQIDRLREEIEILQRRITESESNRRSIIQQTQDLERQVELRRRLVKELENQARRRNQKIKELDRTIGDLENQVERLESKLHQEENNLTALQGEVGRRLSFLYRHGLGIQVSALTRAKNLNDLFQRRRYIQAVQQYDQLQMERLQQQCNAVAETHQKTETARSELVLEKARRLSELERVRSLLAQRREEENQLAAERAKKKKLLDQITSDSELLRALLEERRSALQQIEQAIAQLEKRKPSLPPNFTPDEPFASLKGKLPWPTTRRRLISPYGRNRHPQLGTTTVNPGIDLEANQGDPVRAAAYGQITRIAFIRGFGNTIIISHNKGFYTVYARLGDMTVSEGDIVSSGQIIGEVGESSPEGGFHFEIWSERQSQDPLMWLKR